jgi:hypothetical protein
MTPTQKKFWVLANIIGWGGFFIYNRLEARRQEEESQQRMEYVSNMLHGMEHRNSDFQRRLGCQDVNALGICTDPPCVDSDAGGDADPRYIRGHITYYDGQSSPHRTVEDSCVGPNELREGTCNAGEDGGTLHPEIVTMHCEKGCLEGMCVR